jgi:glycosyltransferase involved in cell wall biosynthesis
MRIAIVTDAWAPQVNGVVRTYEYTCRQLRAMGDTVEVISPEDFLSIPCPTYPSIPLALWPGPGVRRRLERFRPDAVHIATEGPVGHAGRRWCLRREQPFTTTFHTQFPEYLNARVPVPLSWSYRYVRGFHRAAERTLVPTESQRDRLRERGFQNLHIWTRGVNTQLFNPQQRIELDLPRPVAVYMGRVAVEKNIEAFLDLELPGSKVVIGDGPDRHRLMQRYPEAFFPGQMQGVALASHVAAADVFVFPSLTDTFGVVLLEAMACGVPVAAFPVTGPIDVVQPGRTGVLNEDLGVAVREALELDPQDCVDYARSRSWAAATEQFRGLLARA